MFFSYIDDMKSWIIFFLFSLATVDLLLWLDPGIVVNASSIVYFNALLLVALSVFLFWRYRKETDYIRQIAKLTEEPTTDWIEALPEEKFLRDRAVNKMLEEAGKAFSKSLQESRQKNLMQGDYTAAWVHEAKAPLTAMKLIIDANRKDPAAHKLEMEWLRLYLLIDQQLYISRLPSLESDYVLEETVLKNIVSPEVRELMSWCREKNIAIETEELETTVVTDRKWCRFILRQALSNAIKYSPEGGTIFISARKEATGHTILSVRDEGPGIPNHELPRIFDKGFTGGSGRLSNSATGLGLYLAKTVADNIGIRVSALSKKNIGTTMHMAFSLENKFDKTRR